MKSWAILLAPLCILGAIFIFDFSAEIETLLYMIAGGLSGFYIGFATAVERMYRETQGEDPDGPTVNRVINKLLEQGF